MKEQSELRQLKDTVVNLLKISPYGITSEGIRRATGLSPKQVEYLLWGLLRGEPIAYDDTIDNKYYWVGK